MEHARSKRERTYFFGVQGAVLDAIHEKAMLFGHPGLYLP
jgi:hypothetical protein